MKPNEGAKYIFESKGKTIIITHNKTKYRARYIFNRNDVESK